MYLIFSFCFLLSSIDFLPYLLFCGVFFFCFFLSAISCFFVLCYVCIPLLYFVSPHWTCFFPPVRLPSILLFYLKLPPWYDTKIKRVDLTGYSCCFARSIYRPSLIFSPLFGLFPPLPSPPSSASALITYTIPQDVVETTLALDNFKRACDCGRGAVFFSVARGKVRNDSGEGQTALLHDTLFTIVMCASRKNICVEQGDGLFFLFFFKVFFILPTGATCSWNCNNIYLYVNINLGIGPFGARLTYLFYTKPSLKSLT